MNNVKRNTMKHNRAIYDKRRSCIKLSSGVIKFTLLHNVPVRCVISKNILCSRIEQVCKRNHDVFSVSNVLYKCVTEYHSITITQFILHISVCISLIQEDESIYKM